MAVGLLAKYYNRIFRHFQKFRLFQNIRVFFAVNRDIFLRTLCLVAVNLFFTSAGARQGAVILSVNTVLMQLYLFFSYFMDGFAYAGEALGGKTVRPERRRRARPRHAAREARRDATQTLDVDAYRDLRLYLIIYNWRSKDCCPADG